MGETDTEISRMDVINFISKVQSFPDAEITRPDQEYQSGHKYFACGPRLHEFLLALGAILKEYNAFSVGEMPGVDDPEDILDAVGFERGELNMIFQFEMYVAKPHYIHKTRTDRLY
jgi:glycosidase